MNDTAEQHFGIDGTQSLRLQAGQLLMIAERLDLLNFHDQVNLREAAEVDQLRARYGADIVLPDDERLMDTMHFAYRVITEGGELGAVMLAPEPEVRPMVMGLAARAGKAKALRVLYRRGLVLNEAQLAEYLDGEQS